MKWPVLLVVTAQAISAQVLLQPESRTGIAVSRILDAEPTGKSLGCNVSDLDPSLNLSLRYQTGYRVIFPFSRLPEKNGMLMAAFRVTAESTGRTYLFRQIFRFPPIPPKTKLRGGLDGGFFIGEGNYRVKWLLSDLNGQECRKEWRIGHKIRDRDPGLKGKLAPGEVSSFRLSAWTRNPARERPYRIAIFLHAAPIHPRASVLSGYDSSLLITTVASLLEDTPFVETSVVAFNLQKRSEIFRSNRMSHAEFVKLFDALDDVEVATVDLKDLADRKGHLRMLSELVNREITSDQPPDAIVFIGPNNRYEDKFPKEMLERMSPAPQFFYLRHAFRGRFYPFPDSIERLVKSQDGKAFNLITAREFATALRKIEQELQQKKPAPSDGR